MEQSSESMIQMRTIDRAERKRAVIGFVCLQVLLAATALVVDLSARGNDEIVVLGVASVVAGPLALVAGLAWTFQNTAKDLAAARVWHRRRLVMTLVCIALIVSVAMTMWPLRVTFYLSQPALERLAARVEAGDALTFPQRAGLFQVWRAERGANTSFLWLDPDRSYGVGFLHTTGKGRLPNALMGLCGSRTLSEGWEFRWND